jgi:hypothetical protein
MVAAKPAKTKHNRWMGAKIKTGSAKTGFIWSPYQILVLKNNKRAADNPKNEVTVKPLHL